MCRFLTETLGYGACRSVNEFQKLYRIGEGTYGIVYCARDSKSGQVVALKKVRVDSKMSAQVGISDSALREITLLKRFRHENIVELKEVAVSRDPQGMFLVMEYCEQVSVLLRHILCRFVNIYCYCNLFFFSFLYMGLDYVVRYLVSLTVTEVFCLVSETSVLKSLLDLAKLLDEMLHPFTEPQVKCLMQQLFRALDYMHSHYVLHRDLKVSNLLLTSHGILKVADFGLARVFGEPDMNMTPRVITLWYAIDKIINLLGTPTTKIWAELDTLPLLENFTLKTQPFNNVKKLRVVSEDCIAERNFAGYIKVIELALNVVFESASSSAVDLLNALFMYDPKKRISAADALIHPFFTERPLPCDPVLIPSLPPNYCKKRKRDDIPQK
ncbi:kinase domain protein [Dictyocaulus viviparus]|uniref:cyclin-dependent kinase n=1 Tax=Dictyocaulus viviparus TaxID=29172 RepID=A0A0D8XXN2_DICVI|nr:kinase domain protein [Dictyocaulus viviparus]